MWYLPELIIYGNSLARLDVVTIVIAGTFCHGDTDTPVILIKALGAGAAIHREEVCGAALAFGRQGATCALAFLQLVEEGLGGGAALGVFIYPVKTETFRVFMWLFGSNVVQWFPTWSSGTPKQSKVLLPL